MSENGQGSKRKDVSAPRLVVSAAELKAEASAQREREASIQATRACQDPRLLMFLEGTGTDAVAYALDVSSRVFCLPLTNFHYSSAWPGRLQGPHKGVQEAIC